MSARAFVSALALIAAAANATPAVAVDPDSELITCDRADERIDVTADAHLDPSCTWTRGVEILASDVTLDCQGAHIAAPDRRYGIYIHSPTDVPLSNITVRNCHVEGFLNNIHLEREGFRDLPEGVEYENAYSNILIEDSTSLNSRGVGIFVNGYVTGVTLRNLHVEGAGSAGIYLETGSTGTVVEDSTIVNNGFGENGPSGGLFEFAGLSFWFWGTGREGVAIDGSRFNVIRNNHFEGNPAGGVLLYKNCGEFVNSRPQRWFDRRYGSDENTIEGNTFVGGRNGVWIGSRMSENTLPMECSDPEYAPGYRLDYAPDTTVRDNDFQNVTYGVRVEDDRAIIEDNTFTSDDPAHLALVLGTQQRTSVLDRPVDGTSVTGNQAFIAGNPNPYRWIHGHSDTTFEDNESLGRIAGLCEGVQPARGPFVFVVDFIPWESPEPPPGDPPTFPEPEPLPPCPAACAAGPTVEKPTLVLKRIDTPPGDDLLSFKGRVAMPAGFWPGFDPSVNGVAVAVEDASGARVVDVWIPGGAYDRTTGAGWTSSSRGTTWKYVDRRDDPPGGIVKIVLKDRSRQGTGEVQVKVQGKGGSYDVDPANLPLRGLVVLDPPTAETGLCGATSFADSPRGCSTNGKSVVCR